MKAGERTTAMLRAAATGVLPASQAFIYNLSAGTAASWSGSSTGTITAVGNGWYRCTMTLPATIGAGTLTYQIRTFSGSDVYTGDGYSGNYIWGAQLEAGTFPTTYIATVATTITRTVELVQMTGANFTSWYNTEEGSFYSKVIDTKGIVLFGTGNSFANTQYITIGTNNNVAFRSSNVAQAILTAPVASSGITALAFAYKTNDFAAVSNGGVVSTDATGAVPLDQIRLSLGSSAWTISGDNNINGYISKLAYYPARLTNAQLQTLTKS
jgi:hypothetical protein